MVAAIAAGASPTQQTGRYRFSMQQQPEDNLIYWAPSRVRFNLTLILAAVVILLGALQYLGLDPVSALCSPPRNDATQAPPADGQQTPAPGTEEPSSGNEGGRPRNNQAWLLILVGLGVGAYSWLTSPRQYRIYPSSLVIYYGMPRRRTVPFSAIREVANDHGRGAMGDPLRIYTANRRRIPIQVREPDEMYPHLQRALEQFRRDNPQYAPEPEPEAEPASAPEADTPAPDPPAPDPAAGDAERRREGRPRRRSLRDDDDAGGNGNGNSDSGNDGNSNRPRRRRSLRDDNDDGS